MEERTRELPRTRRSPKDIQQRTFEFGVRIIELVNTMPRSLAADTIARQLIRSGTSIGANMQEADGAESKKDFIHKVSIAHKEARESRYWLATLQATVLKNKRDVNTLWHECDQIVRILFAILKKTKETMKTINKEQ